MVPSVGKDRLGVAILARQPHFRCTHHCYIHDAPSKGTASGSWDTEQKAALFALCARCFGRLATGEVIRSTKARTVRCHTFKGRLVVAWMPYDNKDDADGRSHPLKSASASFNSASSSRPQLTLHAGVATLILLVLLQRTLSTILILRFFHGRFLLINCSVRR
jgi:hypothetical protein